MWSEIGYRVVVNVSCFGWFVVGAKCTAQLIVWFGGESVVYFGV